MTRIVWAVTAQRDLRSIRNYIAKDSKVIARRFVSRIKKSATALARWPESGSLLPEEGSSSLREIFVGNDRVIYEFDGQQTVSIVRVLHGARLLPKTDSDSDSDSFLGELRRVSAFQVS